jgi:hypothetical protein
MQRIDYGPQPWNRGRVALLTCSVAALFACCRQLTAGVSSSTYILPREPRPVPEAQCDHAILTAGSSKRADQSHNFLPGQYAAIVAQLKRAAQSTGGEAESLH